MLQTNTLLPHTYQITEKWEHTLCFCNRASTDRVERKQNGTGNQRLQTPAAAPSLAGNPTFSGVSVSAKLVFIFEKPQLWQVED